MIHPSNIEKWLFYEETNHGNLMKSFGMVILQGRHEVGLYTTRNTAISNRAHGRRPVPGDLKHWHNTGMMREDVLLLEELLLLLRLPLAAPGVSMLDGISHRLEIGAGDQLLQLEWSGPKAPLCWQPLDELTHFFRDLRVRASTPGYYRPSPL